MEQTITHDEAIRILNKIMVGVQKTRSNILETGMPEIVLADLQPRLFGPGSILPILNNMLDAEEEQRGAIKPMDFWNMLVMVKLIDPTTGGMVELWTQEKLPAPTTDLMKELLDAWRAEGLPTL